VKPVHGYSLFVLELLLTRGPLVQRGGAWVAADGTGASIKDVAVQALARRELVTIGVTGYGRTAAASPKGALWRARNRARLHRQWKGKPCPQDISPPPG